MQATTTLSADLRDALRRVGHARHTDEITRLLPDRGQYELTLSIRGGNLDRLLARWIGDLADILRCPEADAAHIRDLLTGATR